MHILYIFLGGGLGCLSRYGMSKLVHWRFEGINPMATLCSNLLSVIVLSLVIFGLSKSSFFTQNWHSFLVVGFCGGFSTFSTFSYEIFELMKDGNYLWAGLNVVVSIVMALILLFILSKILA